jgi:hypothetical protein
MQLLVIGTDDGDELHIEVDQLRARDVISQASGAAALYDVAEPLIAHAQLICLLVVIATQLGVIGVGLDLQGLQVPVIVDVGGGSADEEQLRTGVVIVLDG